MSFRNFIAFAIALFAAALIIGWRLSGEEASGPNERLRLGDPAPPLAVAEWVKGGPIDLAEGKGESVYLLDFWATWCGPCQANIPELTRLQKKYADRGLVVIASTKEPGGVVRSFVERHRNAMDYAVFADDNARTYHAYMTDFGVEGYPCMFLVDRRGLVVWQGRGLAELRPVLERLLPD